MQTLDRSLSGVSETIPVPWPRLNELVQPGPGHLVLLLGAPGVGKSSFALQWTLEMGEPTLIVSQDTDLATQAARTVAHMVGISFADVKEDLPKWEAYLKASVPTLPMMLDYPLLVDDLDPLVIAAEEFYGTRPRMVVVDVLRNVVPGAAYEDFMETFRELHRVARKHHITIVVLHHLNRQGKNASGTKPVRLDDGQYGGEQECEIVLGLWTPRGKEDVIYGWVPYNEPMLRVSVLKNRNGPKDPDGMGVYVDMRADLERMQIG